MATTGVTFDYRSMQVERARDDVLLVTMNRPERLNAITFDTFDEIIDLCEKVTADTSIRAAVITGRGRAFCAGLDLDEANTLESMTAMEMMYGQEHWAAAFERLYELPVPLIAAINGPATGGGLAIALAADIRIASTAARFNSAFVRIGLSSGDIGVSWALPRIIGMGHAAEMMMTGRFYDAEEARAIGLVNRVVEPSDLLDSAYETAAQIAANTPLGVMLTKRLLASNVDAGGLRSAMEIENRGQVLATRGADFREALAAFREKRQPTYTGR
jgi:enoyl-CoA hydratase/carnithine racemase